MIFLLDVSSYDTVVSIRPIVWIESSSICFSFRPVVPASVTVLMLNAFGTTLNEKRVST